mmetsp:Transcript_130500/g.365102  ORF Transcript_130500/g.365102 Transcript_130500/m.365102 type:complete len:226 (+) Transcript_130500:108-785(+)
MGDRCQRSATTSDRYCQSRVRHARTARRARAVCARPLRPEGAHPCRPDRHRHEDGGHAHVRRPTRRRRGRRGRGRGGRRRADHVRADLQLPLAGAGRHSADAPPAVVAVAGADPLRLRARHRRLRWRLRPVRASDRAGAARENGAAFASRALAPVAALGGVGLPAPYGLQARSLRLQQQRGELRHHRPGADEQGSGAGEHRGEVACVAGFSAGARHTACHEVATA